MSDRLELRPNWFILTRLLFASFASFAVGAFGWLALQAGSQDAWPVAAAGMLLGLCGVAVVFRCRLILTPEGFRVRFLLTGRLVPWSTVQGFEADVAPRGIRWLPRDRPAMPHSTLQWIAAIAATGRRHIPLFGASTADLLATMSEWLIRYSAPQIQTTESRVIMVDDERLLQENPELHDRLQRLRRRYQGGETVSPAEFERLLKDVVPWSSASDQTKS